MSNDHITIVRTRMVDGTDKVQDVARDLGLTPGKTAFIKMQILVADGTVPAITGTPKQKIAKIVNARKKADQYSSWGWLAARSGLNEGSMKNAVTETEKVQVYGSRIAQIRAEKRAKKAA